MSLRDKILSSKDIKEAIEHVPEWDADVKVKSLTGYQRDEFERSMVLDEKITDKTAHLQNIRARLVSLTCYDPETDKLVFAPSDILALGCKSGDVLGRLFKKAKELSGMLDDLDVEAKK